MKTIYVDIDNTICNTTKCDYRNSVPIFERIQRINKLYDEGNTIIYWTARGYVSGIPWTIYTYNQLKRWGCKFHQVKVNKPNYDLFIDDKNINSEDFF